MRKPGRLRLKILLFSLFGIVLALWLWRGWPCVYRHFLGIPCPGCGMSRAWHAVLRLDLAAALRYHPMFWSVPVFGLYILYDGQLIGNRRLDRWVLGLLLGGFFLCYIIRLVMFLGGSMPI